ncbi:MAG: DUF72 domain-containing protein [Kiritimatiellae bacterium]|nr:DUF72 domain-containing protein [Kiritimatiellia bacterium]
MPATKQGACYIVGTSGYSFADWVGAFYPAGTRQNEMFTHYVAHFRTVEINYTFYRMPAARTLEALARKTPAGFDFWVKLNQKISHERERNLTPGFLDSLRPLQEAGKLAGVLVQFPQRFHRTPPNRRFLADLAADLERVPTAVEFRHHSWNDERTLAGLRARNITLVVPDVPALPGLFRIGPVATTRMGYLRLHSRDGEKWYGNSTERYDYSYSDAELNAILAEWAKLGKEVDRVYAFFNNCHGGQAARNAEAFRRILEQIQ